MSEEGRTTKGDPLWLAVFLLLFGVVCAVVAFRQAHDAWLLSTSGVRTTGTVVDLRQEWDSKHRSKVYRPVVPFTAAAGRSVVVQLSETFHEYHRIGDSVSVLYSSDTPTVAIIDQGIIWEWLKLLLLGCVPAFCFAAGTAMLRQRKSAPSS